MAQKRRTKFEFRPKRGVSVASDTPQEFTRNASRRVTIVAPPQIVDGKRQAVVVTALPLPTKPPPNPPEGKGIQRLINMVINPHVQVVETGRTLYDFNPPLTFTIEFTAEDAKAATRDPVTGAPQLSIITHYQDEKKGWRWQKWETAVKWVKSSDTGTLKADVKTLHPNDPVSEGD